MLEPAALARALTAELARPADLRTRWKISRRVGNELALLRSLALLLTRTVAPAPLAHSGRRPTGN